MKLYQTYASPFPTRVRLMLYAKGLEAEIIEPPGFHASAESKGDYLAINPIGRVPALVLDDGRVLPESEVICEYLEDAFPTPPLRPADAWGRARMRLLTRICDFYLVMAMVPLFNLSARSRRHWEPRIIEAAAGKVAEALGFLEAYIGEDLASRWARPSPGLTAPSPRSSCWQANGSRRYSGRPIPCPACLGSPPTGAPFRLIRS